VSSDELGLRSGIDRVLPPRGWAQALFDRLAVLPAGSAVRPQFRAMLVELYLPLAEYLAARRAARDDADPTWLAYTCYGDPAAMAVSGACRRTAYARSQGASRCR
jgi:hypothetical protein